METKSDIIQATGKANIMVHGISRGIGGFCVPVAKHECERAHKIRDGEGPERCHRVHSVQSSDSTEPHELRDRCEGNSVCTSKDEPH